MKLQLYGHLPAEYCWRRKDELISDVLLWNPLRVCASVGWPRRIYQKQHWMEMGCSLENLPGAMDDKDEWGELVGFYGISTFVGYLCQIHFYTNNQFYFKQFSLVWVISLIVKNISISNYSVYSNRANSV